MAQIDPSIALGFRPIQVESPVNQMAAIAQMQGAQQQAQMNALKMQEYQQQQAERNALARIMSTPGMEFGSDAFMNRVLAEAPSMYEGVATRASQRAELAEKVEERKFKNFDRKFNLVKSVIPAIRSVEDVDKFVTTAYNDPDLSPVLKQIQPFEDALRTNRELFSADPNTWRLQVSGVSAEKIAEMAAAKTKAEAEAKKIAAETAKAEAATGTAIAQLRRERDALAAKDPNDPLIKQYDAAIAKETGGTPPEIVREYEYAVKNNGFKGTLLQFKEQIAKAGRPITAAAPAPVTPVTVVDPNDPTKTVVKDARTGRVIGEGVKEGPKTQLSAKDIQKREASYPQATLAVKGIESKADSLIKDLNELKNHPGLNQITGLVGGRVPGVTDEARAAQALYDRIVARGGFQMLQEMREASKTGGALGNVSNQEGKQLQAAFAAIDRRQSMEDLQRVIDQTIADIEGAKMRSREAYDETYSYRSSEAAAPARPAPRQMSQQDRDALNWANSNPNDPRAAAIKQRLGVQ